MEAWLTELEMEINNYYPQNYQSEELMDTSFNEQLTYTLGEDFPYPLCSNENIQHKTTFPQLGFDYDIIDQPALPSLEKNQNQHDNNYKDSYDVVQEINEQLQNNKEEAKKKAVSIGTKRKRQPSQVQDHIIAERKRRELLGQLFISLSALVPGLKKTDKTSVLGEAIKYMKQLKEKVKVLEEVATKRSMETIVVVKKSQLSVDNESGDDNDSSCTMDCNCGQPNNGSNDNERDYLFPEIEVKISGKTLLLRVYCQNGKGVIAKLFALVDKHDMSISSCNVIPLESLALDITILAVMETGFNSSVKDFVKSLRSSFPSTISHCCCTSS